MKFLILITIIYFFNINTEADLAEAIKIEKSLKIL